MTLNNYRNSNTYLEFHIAFSKSHTHAFSELNAD